MIQAVVGPQQSGGFLRPERDIEHMAKAIESLRLLDRNNRIVERSTEYVEYLLRIVKLQSQTDPLRAVPPAYDQPQQQAGSGTFDADFGALDANNELPDLSEFLNTNMEVAQFFASGIFDMQDPLENFMSGYQ